jgi:ERCC4-type nuclease
VAVDLVLERARENRAQFVFTRLRDGREAIFWQSPRTTAQARPGIRVPTRRASGAVELAILVDTRERYPYRFSHQQAVTERRALPAGDYGVEADGEIVAVVERKTVADLAGRLVDGSLTYALAELATLERAALVVEDRYGDVFKLTHVAAGFVADLLAAVQVRYPTVPIVFCDTRPLAEEWTFRFLGAALAFIHAETDASRLDQDR